MGILIFLFAGAAFIGVMWIRPLFLDRLRSEPDPVSSYEAATTRIASIQALDGSEYDPRCFTQVMTHGQKVQRAIIFLHGYTNCPQQFVPLGQQFYEAGYNVYIPRMPAMGLADKMTPAQANLTAEAIVKWSDTSVDIAQGLGEEVTVVGLSGGATAAAWIAQTRGDVKRAVLIAPVFGIYDAAAWLTRPMVGLALTLPNRFGWWDSARKESLPGPAYGYPRFSTRASAELIRLGFAVEAAAQQARPQVSSILIVTNAGDIAVNKDRINQMLIIWQKYLPLQTYEFEIGLNLKHDLIDINQPDQNTALVYPILFKLITQDQTSLMMP